MPKEPEETDADQAPLSYSYRDRPDRFRTVLFDRITVTAGLFATAMGLSYLLGRKR